MKPLSEETWVTPTLLRTHGSEEFLLRIRSAFLASFFLPPVHWCDGWEVLQEGSRFSTEVNR